MKYEQGEQVIVLSPYLLVEGEPATIRLSFMDDGEEYYVVKFNDGTYQLCGTDELVRPIYQVGDIVEYDHLDTSVTTTTIREVTDLGCYVAGSTYHATDFIPYKMLRKPVWEDFPESPVIPVELADEHVIEEIA
jgi:hypothetical protein